MSDVKLEDVVISENILKEILNLESCRGYIFTKESNIYPLHGFRTLGFDYKVVSNDLSATQIMPEDVNACMQNLEKYAFAPFFKYSNGEPLLTVAEMYEFLLLNQSKHLFMMDDCGGVVHTIEDTNFLKKINTKTISAVRTGLINNIDPEFANYGRAR